MEYHKIFFVSMFSFTLNYCMEQPLASRTAINITKGSIYDVDGTVDILVVGVREQKRLYSSFEICDEKGYPINTVGEVKFRRRGCSSAYVMKKEDDSDSVQETDHHPCGIVKHWGHNFDWKTMNSRVLWVVEPKLRNTWYGNKRENYEYWQEKDRNMMHGESAIQAAQEHLFICYNNILKAGLKKLGNKENKSIAIPTLSASCYLPRQDAAIIALIAITDFVKNNPGAYSRIELFVKKRCEFEWYCKWFL
ncbi:MAG TPA: hypothetical protein VKU36_01660 [Candidatus Babeliales bacterium]|nr:hypothetical protein [Candidatus Babeliales bacterium]